MKYLKYYENKKELSVEDIMNIKEIFQDIVEDYKLIEFEETVIGHPDWNHIHYTWRIFTSSMNLYIYTPLGKDNQDMYEDIQNNFITRLKSLGFTTEFNDKQDKINIDNAFFKIK